MLRFLKRSHQVSQTTLEFTPQSRRALLVESCCLGLSNSWYSRDISIRPGWIFFFLFRYSDQTYSTNMESLKSCFSSLPHFPIWRSLTSVILFIFLKIKQYLYYSDLMDSPSYIQSQDDLFPLINAQERKCLSFKTSLEPCLLPQLWYGLLPAL